MEAAVPIAAVAESITGLFKMSDLQTVITTCATAGAGFMVVWFGARKVTRAVVTAFKRGRISL